MILQYLQGTYKNIIVLPLGMQYVLIRIFINLVLHIVMIPQFISLIFFFYSFIYLDKISVPERI